MEIAVSNIRISVVHAKLILDKTPRAPREELNPPDKIAAEEVSGYS